MKTSKYDIADRRRIKRLSRQPQFSEILKRGRDTRKELETKLSARNIALSECSTTIGLLQKALQDLINSTKSWNPIFEKLGLEKPGLEKSE